MKTTNWTLEAVDSALERGSLAEWRELFADVRKNKTTAAAHDLGGEFEVG